MLKSAAVILLSITLAACNSNGVITVYPDTATNQLSIKQQTWVLKSVNGVDINTLATLHINDDLSASGSAGCNNYSGQGEMDENKFRIRQMAMTRKLCEPQVMKGEQAVSQVLSGWSEIALSGNHLSLQNSVHKLIFRPE